MPSGTGIDLFQKEFPNRTFDVGIAEQHGVTFAAGLATEGFKPFATIYSTFLQRAYDQVVHDVAIQRLPVRFAMDRAGLVGADGPTHAGAFDIAYLGCLPNFVLMAAADEAELVHMVATAVAIDDRPSALRYPRGEGRGVPMPEEGKPLEIGKGRILREGTKVALFSYGARLGECLKAADELAAYGLSTTVADARFAKPLDVDLLLRLAREHEVLLTIEEGSIGGFGSFVLQTLAEHGVLDRGLKVRSMVLPDIFIDQDSPNAMYAKAGLDAKGIVTKAFEALGQNHARRSGEARLTAAGIAAPRCSTWASCDARHNAGHHVYNAAMTARERADRLLVARGLFESRARAQAAIAAGPRDRRWRAGAQGFGRDLDAADHRSRAEHPYVSRGGVKLEAALDHFSLDVAGRVCLDVGASTGGFTEVLLGRGARRVYAVDVGSGQLHPRLRGHNDIVSIEQTDIRNLDPSHLPGAA